MSNRLKIFVLLSRIPYPLIKGDKLRAFNQIKELSVDHDVYLCALSDSKIPESAQEFLSPYCSEIHFIRLSRFRILLNVLHTALFTNKPLQIGYFYQKKASIRINELISQIQPDHIYCQLIRVAEYVRKRRHYPKTLDYMDSLSSGMERRFKKAKGIKKIIFKFEMIRLKRYEHLVFDDFDFKTIISERDRQLIVNYRNDEIHIVENGVDLSYYSPESTAKKYELIFTGNMSYPPNIEAAIYLIKDIMPKVRQKIPTANLIIAGAKPGRRLKELIGKGVELTGSVADIRPYYNQSRVFIAPMEIGSGLQNKLLEAMAMKLPCITSNLANQSLLAKEGDEILIGRSSEEYAMHAIQLLENKDSSDYLAEQGHSLVRSKYSWTKSVKKLNEIFETAIEKK